MKSLRFSSRPRPWAYALIPFGLLFFLIAVVVMREDVWAPRWPWCGRCGVTRVVRLLAGLALMFGALSRLPALVDGHAGLEAVGLIVVAVLGLALVSRSYASAVAGAHVSRDSQWVRVPRAHERFAAQVVPGAAGAP
ncbi:MAG TPA: hypothetical protein VL738_38565 [Dactylosporangium sp.]|nr:hypothetical protein [Dactylosporangium sp.]